MQFRRKARHEAAAQQWATDVVTVLVPHFPGLTSPDTRREVVESLADWRLDPNQPLEIILDDLALANWRLRADPEHPGRLRVADYQIPSRDGGRYQSRVEREARLTALVQAIG